MNRPLSPIGEHDHLTSSSEATSYEDLPTVTPMLRTFEETTQRQNAENAQLRKQLLAYKEKEDKLHDRVQELEELTAALVNPTGRNPTDKTANNTNEPRNPASAFTPQAVIPSSPLGLTPRVPRPQDVAYQAALQQGKQHKQTREKVLQKSSQQRLGYSKCFRSLHKHLSITTMLTSRPRHTSLAKTMNGKHGTASSAPT
jgi:hypothetical protein